MTPGPITSTANARVKATARLRDRAARDSRGLTLVDGGREIGRAVAAGVEVEEAFVCPDLIRSADARSADAALRAAGVPVVEVTPSVLDRLAFGDRSDGLVAVVRVPPSTLGDLPPLPRAPLLVVVEGVEKPGNLGAILRSADGAGADAVIAASPRTDLFNPNAIRASLGTIFSVPVAAADARDVRAWLEERAIRIVTTRVDAARSYTEADLGGPVAIVAGSEADGLGGAWTGPGIEAVSLPMHGIADSLNVSVATSIILYEAVRQRAARGGTGD